MYRCVFQYKILKQEMTFSSFIHFQLLYSSLGWLPNKIPKSKRSPVRALWLMAADQEPFWKMCVSHSRAPGLRAEVFRLKQCGLCYRVDQIILSNTPRWLEIYSIKSQKCWIISSCVPLILLLFQLLRVFEV